MRSRQWRLWGTLCACAVALGAVAQPAEPANRYTTHATLMGVGRSSLYDTYLSPSTYRGPVVSVMHESLRKTHWAGGRITTQGMADGSFSRATNRADNAHELAGMMGYAQGWHYNWTWRCGLRLAAGAQAHASLGMLYNNRNSNNPVQVKAAADIAAVLMAVYPFHIRRQTLAVRYQCSLPLVGVMFSPQYGQSYYEMSQGNYDHNVCATYPGNAPSMRHLLTLDFPIAGFTFRAGYLCDISQSTVNSIRSHIWNHSFMLGYVKHFTFVKRREARHKSFVL